MSKMREEPDKLNIDRGPHHAAVTAARFNSNFSLVLSADEAGRIVLWDLERGRHISEFDSDKVGGGVI
jgi:WD40 repeat protein